MGKGIALWFTELWVNSHITTSQAFVVPVAGDRCAVIPQYHTKEQR